MRARHAAVVLGVLLAPLAADGRADAAGTLRCGMPHRGLAFAGGIDCQVRPPGAGLLTSASLPIKVHFDPAQAAMAAVVLSAAETSWTFENVTMGFALPLTDAGGGGDDAFDVYLEPSSFGGYFCPEGGVQDATGYRYFGWVSVNPEAFDTATMPAVVAHELNHAMQLGIDGLEDPSFMEMTSAYVMEQVFDDANLAAGFIEVFQENPTASLDYYVYAESYQYGASLFLFWLVDDLFGGNYQALSYLWNAAQQPYDPALPDYNEPDYFDTLTLLAEGNDLTLKDLYMQFAAARWFTGAEDDGTFAEGGDWTGVTTAGSYGLSQLPKNTVAGPAVSEFGAAYFEVGLDRNPGPDAFLRFHFEAPSNPDFRVLALKPGVTGAQRVVELAFDAEGNADIGGLEGREKVVFVVVNLGDGSHDPDADDWGGNGFSYAIRYDDGRGAAGCGCALPGAGRSPAGPMVLALVLLAATFRKRGHA